MESEDEDIPLQPLSFTCMCVHMNMLPYKKTWMHTLLYTHTHNFKNKILFKLIEAPLLYIKFLRVNREAIVRTTCSFPVRQH